MFKEAKYLSRNKIKMIWLLLLSALAINCGVISNNQPKGNMSETIHKNGLTVKLPENLSAKQSDNGFTIEPSDGSNKNIRIPIEINIGLFADNNNIFADESLSKNKTVATRNIKYQIQKDDGGSGGETYAFIGYETNAKGCIKYSQTLQSKYDEPDFATLWQVIENTSVKK
jgi:hypothetical protein